MGKINTIKKCLIQAFHQVMPVLQEDQVASKTWTELPCIAATSHIAIKLDSKETILEI